MTPADLDRLDALAAAATPGPWQWLDSGGDPGDYDELQDGNGEMVASGFRDDVLSDITDGRLCAALRNAAPQLIAAARLGAAWQAAEAALPEGWPNEAGQWVIPSGRWSITVVHVESGDGFSEPYEEGYKAFASVEAFANPAQHVVRGDLGPTPAAALLSLEAALRERP